MSASCTGTSSAIRRGISRGSAASATWCRSGGSTRSGAVSSSEAMRDQSIQLGEGPSDDKYWLDFARARISGRRQARGDDSDPMRPTRCRRSPATTAVAVARGGAARRGRWRRLPTAGPSRSFAAACGSSAASSAATGRSSSSSSPTSLVLPAALAEQRRARRQVPGRVLLPDPAVLSRLPTFGQAAFGEPNYRALRDQFAAGEHAATGCSCRPFPTARTSRCSTCPDSRHIRRRGQHPFGTDDRGRDVLVRLAYGFNISLTFALLVMLFGDGIGIVVGAVARVRRRQARSARPAGHRDLVVAAVPLHDHHRQLDRRARVRARPHAGAAAVVLAAGVHPGGVRVDGDHVLRPRRVLPGEGARTTSAPRSSRACLSRRSCSGTSCRTR